MEPNLKEPTYVRSKIIVGLQRNANIVAMATREIIDTLLPEELRDKCGADALDIFKKYNIPIDDRFYKQDDMNSTEIDDSNCIQFLDYYLETYQADQAADAKSLEAWAIIKTRLAELERRHGPFNRIFTQG